VHQARRLVNDLLLEPACHSYLTPGGAPASFKRGLGARELEAFAFKQAIMIPSSVRHRGSKGVANGFEVLGRPTESN
jgi:hypothetical protein